MDLHPAAGTAHLAAGPMLLPAGKSSPAPLISSTDINVTGS